MSKTGIHNQAITLLDVAKHAGVSKSTASAAFSPRKSSIRMSSETRARIIEAGQALGYRPNIIAKSLATKKSFLIAMIGRKDLAFVTIPMVTILQDILREHNYSLIVYMCNNQLDEEKEALELSCHRKVDAVLIQPNLDIHGHANDEVVTGLQKNGIAVVQLFNNILKNVPTVKGDYYAMAYNAVKILFDRGRRKIGYLTYDFDSMHDLPTKIRPEIEQKYHGYKAAVADLGMEEHPVTYLHDNRFRSLDCVHRNADSIFPQLVHLDSVVAYSNSGGYGLLRILEKKNVKVPHDIAVIGTSDDLHTPVPFMPELSYYSLDRAEVAREAVSLCFKYIQNMTPANQKKTKKEEVAITTVVKPILFKGETI